MTAFEKEVMIRKTTKGGQFNAQTCERKKLRNDEQQSLLQRTALLKEIEQKKVDLGKREHNQKLTMKPIKVDTVVKMGRLRLER